MLKTLIGDLLTVGELAKALGVEVCTVYAYNSNGTGPKRYKVGKNIGYKKEDVQAWLESRAIGGTK